MIRDVTNLIYLDKLTISLFIKNVALVYLLIDNLHFGKVFFLISMLNNFSMPSGSFKAAFSPVNNSVKVQQASFYDEY